MPTLAYANSPITGPRLKPTRNISSLQYSIGNLAVGKSKKGTNVWIGKLTKLARAQEFKELQGVLGTRKKPKNPKIVIVLKDKNKKTAKPTGFGAGEVSRKKRKTFEPRIERAVVALEKCDPAHLSYVVVVTSISTDHRQVFPDLKRDGERLDRYIRTRFPGAIYIMMPEADAHLIGDLQSGLMPDQKWKVGFPDNHFCYKNHYNVALYHPGIAREDLDEMFQRTPTGKRSKLFSGANQVRAIPFDMINYGNGDVPDIRGVIGYSQKYLYKPPMDQRMAEGFAEWLFIRDQIDRDPSLVRVGGTRFLNAKPKPSHTLQNAIAAAARTKALIEANRLKKLRATQNSVNDVHAFEEPAIANSSISNGLLLNLNSVLVTHSEGRAKSTKIKFAATVVRAVAAVKKVLNRLRFWDTS